MSLKFLRRLPIFKKSHQSTRLNSTLPTSLPSKVPIPVVENDYGEFHAYGVIQPQPRTIRHIHLAIVWQRHDGYVVVETVDNGERTRNEYRMTCPSHILRETTCTIIELRGRIDDSLGHWLSGIAGASGLRIQAAKLSISPVLFSSLLHKHSIHSLLIARSVFEDAQLISDSFFAANHQLRSIRISALEGHALSFPLLTDRCLIRWSKQHIIPSTIEFNNVETGFSAEAVCCLIEAAGYTSPRTVQYQWQLGRVRTKCVSAVRLLSPRLPDLIVYPVHNSHVHIMSDESKYMYAHFYTAVSKRTLPSSLN